MQLPLLPVRESVGHRRTTLADLVVALELLLLLYIAARVGAGALVHLAPPNDVPCVSLHPLRLPHYTARSTLWMFVAMGCSLVYGYVAARSRRTTVSELRLGSQVTMPRTVSISLLNTGERTGHPVSVRAIGLVQGLDVYWHRGGGAPAEGVPVAVALCLEPQALPTIDVLLRLY